MKSLLSNKIKEIEQKLEKKFEHDFKKKITHPERGPEALKSFHHQSMLELLKEVRECVPKKSKKHWLDKDGRMWDVGFNKCIDIILQKLEVPITESSEK